MGNQVWHLRFDARIAIASDVAVGPAVESAILNTGEIVRGEIFAQFVALVHGNPWCSGDRFDEQAHRIPQTGGILARIFPVKIADGYGCADGGFAGADVAAGADGNQQVFAVRSDCQIARIMPATREIEQLFGFTHTF